MPDDDWALGQNEVDVRNEAWNPLNAIPIKVDECVPKGLAVLVGPDGLVGGLIFACRNPEYDWITEARDLQAEQDLAHAIDYQRRLHEAVPVSPEAEQRRQEALALNIREIQRLIGS